MLQEVASSGRGYAPPYRGNFLTMQSYDNHSFPTPPCLLLREQQPQFGVDFDLTDPISLYIAIGANMAQAKNHVFDFYNPGDVQDEYKGLASSLVFHLGIKF